MNLSIRFMRIACPLALVAALVLAYFSYATRSHLLLAINLFLAGANLYLSCIQWFVFKIEGDS